MADFLTEKEAAELCGWSLTHQTLAVSKEGTDLLQAWWRNTLSKRADGLHNSSRIKGGLGL